MHRTHPLPAHRLAAPPTPRAAPPTPRAAPPAALAASPVGRCATPHTTSATAPPGPAADRPSTTARPPRRGERGQGTVEYVALVLLVAGVLAAAVGTAGQGFKPGELAKTVSAKISESIGAVGGKAPATTGGGAAGSGK